MKHGVTDMLKVILFDVDNTILSFDEYVKESMKNGFEKFEIGTYKEIQKDDTSHRGTGNKEKKGV